ESGVGEAVRRLRAGSDGQWEGAIPRQGQPRLARTPVRGGAAVGMNRTAKRKRAAALSVQLGGGVSAVLVAAGGAGDGTRSSSVFFAAKKAPSSPKVRSGSLPCSAACDSFGFGP